MEEIKFSSINELYERVTPALHTKRDELRRAGLFYINERDIWDFLRKTKWAQNTMLELCDIVDDILNVDAATLHTYMKTMTIDIPKAKINNEES